MTRAADRLIVGGCLPGNMRSVRPLSWYDLIAKGLAGSDLQLQEIETAAGRVKRYTRAEETAPPAAPAAAPPPPAPMVLPNWLLTPAQPEISAESFVRPSDPAEDGSHKVRTRRIARAARPRPAARHAGAPAAAIAAGYRRGRAAARPRWPIWPAMPMAGARRNGRRWPKARWRLIADPRFAPVFAPGSRAEVSIVGRLERPGGRPALVSGQIDRLVVTDTRGPDRRFQDQPCPARPAGRGAEGLCPPARAVPGGAGQALSPAARSRGAALDRNR